VAAATGHWDVAEQVYGSIDAVNLLVDRGDDAAAAGDTQAAAHWYGAAAASLAAAARPPAPGAPGLAEATLDPRANRAILLLRVGRGLLLVRSYGSALTVLEKAESEMHADPPALRDRQAIRFALAEALARTLPPGAERTDPTRTRISTQLDRALEVADSGWARLQQAKILLALGDRTGAIDALRTSLQRDPGSPEPYLVLGALFESDGLEPLARDLYGRGLEEVPNHPDLSAAWAKASFRTMTPTKSLPRLLDAAATDTRDPYLFAALGDCHLALGDPDAARAAYREGLRRTPGAAPLRDRLARFARPTGSTF
jgi:tetratricopeptide (TPR) repeat protein